MKYHIVGPLPADRFDQELYVLWRESPDDDAVIEEFTFGRDTDRDGIEGVVGVADDPHLTGIRIYSRIGGPVDYSLVRKVRVPRFIQWRNLKAGDDATTADVEDEPIEQ